MLKKFTPIYEKLRKMYEGTFDQILLDSPQMRGFVYEVCKECCEVELAKPHNQQINSDWTKNSTCPDCGTALEGYCPNCDNFFNRSVGY
jgi:hypothetical protein